MRNVYDDTVIRKRIEKLKQCIQRISKNIGELVSTPIPLISTGKGSEEKLINESYYRVLERYERHLHLTLLAIMFFFVDKGYSDNQISITNFDYFTGLLSGLTWIIYLILFVIWKGLSLKIFNFLLCIQLGYFFFRISFETGQFIFLLVGLIVPSVISIRSFLIKP